MWQDLMVPPLAKPLVNRLFTNGQCSSAGILLYDKIANGGTGKTTFVEKFIEFSGWPTIRLDTAGEAKSSLKSLEDQLDLAQASINLFCNPNVSLGNPKVVIVGHEISKSSKDFIDGLREFMDKYDEVALFLFTDNDFDKLSTNNPQMFKQQRIVSLNWDLIDLVEIRDYCYCILKHENLDTLDNRKIVDTLITVNRASIRGTIIGMENNCK